MTSAEIAIFLLSAVILYIVVKLIREHYDNNRNR